MPKAGRTILHFPLAPRWHIVLLIYRPDIGLSCSPAQEIFSTMDRRPSPTNFWVTLMCLASLQGLWHPWKRSKWIFQRLPGHAEGVFSLSLSESWSLWSSALAKDWCTEYRAGNPKELCSWETAQLFWLPPDCPDFLLPHDSLQLCLYLGSYRKGSLWPSLRSSWWTPTPTLVLCLNDERHYLCLFVCSYHPLYITVLDL